MSKEETTQAVSLKSQCHVFASLQSARLDKDTCVQKQLDKVQQNGKDCSIFKVCFTLQDDVKLRGVMQRLKKGLIWGFFTVYIDINVITLN